MGDMLHEPAFRQTESPGVMQNGVMEYWRNGMAEERKITRSVQNKSLNPRDPKAAMRFFHTPPLHNLSIDDGLF
jgi:hypothetical protein